MSASVPGGPTDASRVTLIVFPGGFNWPVWVAQERGSFARHGIAVDVVTTPGSVFQWSTIAKGEAQIAITLMDNVVAYREGMGEGGIVVDDAVALMGLDTRAMPALITTPDISSYADLRGKTLAVDALKTGNALVLIGMLERGGLKRGEFELTQAGGVLQRFEAVKRKEYAGSLFNAPFDGLLRNLGFNVLDTADALLDHFQAHVVAARSGWAGAHRSIVVAFLRAMVEALEWLYDPHHRAEAFALYEQNVPGAAPDAAATAYAVLFHPISGFVRGGALDVDGIRAVLGLRARYGEPKKALADALAYCDSGFLAEAVGDAR